MSSDFAVVSTFELIGPGKLGGSSFLTGSLPQEKMKIEIIDNDNSRISLFLMHYSFRYLEQIRDP